MKKTFKLAFLIIGVLSIVGNVYAGDGNIFIVENGKGNVPVVINKDAYSLADFGEAGGEKNTGSMIAGPIHKMIGSVALHYVTLEPGGYIGNHAGTSNYTCIIANGDGVYGHGTAEGKDSKLAGSEINFKKGDIIVVRPNAFHWWKGGKETAEIWVIEDPQ